MKATLALVALLLALPAHASHKGRAPAANADSGPIDELQESLYKPTKDMMKDVRKVRLLKTGWAFLQDGKFQKARNAVSSLKTDSDFGDYSRWITAEAMVAQAQQALDGKKPADAKKLANDAIALLASFEANYPYSPLLKVIPRTLSHADFVLGKIALGEKKWALAKPHFEGGLERLGTPAELPFVRPSDIGGYGEACSHETSALCDAWMLKLAQSYPKISLEFKQIIRFYPQYANHVPKTPFFGKLIQSYRAPDPDQVAFDLAMTTCLEHKYPDAIQKFRSFLDDFPRSQYRYRASYWLGQALKQEKKDDESKKVLNDLRTSSPLTYYGLLGALATGNDFSAPIQSSIPSAADSDPFLLPHELVRIRRAKLFLSQKASELAGIELKGFRGRDSLSSPFMMYLAMLQSDSQSYSATYPILNDLVNRGNTDTLTSFVVKMIFPTPDFQLIKKQATDVQVDPLLILSLIKQESAFDANAISSSGALGMMQLMPATASTVDGSVERFDLLKPDKNIQVGTRYISKLLARFGGNTVLAVAAYNAGPGAVSRWLKAAPPGWTMLEFIESIPYKETREYVAAIIRNYYWYAKKLDPQLSKTLTLDHFWSKPTQQVISAPVEAEETSPIPTAPSDEVMGPPEPKGSPSPGVVPSPVASPSPLPVAKVSATPSSAPSPLAQPLPVPSPSPSAAPTKK